MKKDNKKKRHVYWNPYFGGFLLGLLLIFTFYMTGRGFGASGALKSTVVTVVDVVAPSHAEHNGYYSRFISDEKSPMNTWLVFEVIGLLAGAFMSGAFTDRLNFRIQNSPNITKKKRLYLALSGGIIFGLGAQLARGCTSGAGLSGMAVLSTGGFLTVAVIFGAGYAFAYFFRKNWI